MAGATKGTVMELKSSRQHDHSQSPAYPPGQQGVASYRSYEDACQAVARLAEQDFPVARVSIVGHGLNFVEQVTGRRGFLASGLAGMANGAGIGALFGLVAGLFNWVDPLVSAFALGLYGLLLGAILGFLFGLISRAGAGPLLRRTDGGRSLRRRRRRRGRGEGPQSSQHRRRGSPSVRRAVE